MNNEKRESEEENSNPSSTYQRSAYDQRHDRVLNEAEMLCIYIGPNAHKFLPIYFAEKRHSFLLSFNFAVLFAPLAWFYYRKMYLYGLFFNAFPAFVGMGFFPKAPYIGFILTSIILACFANKIYVQVARHRINKLKSISLSPRDLNQLLLSRGGTSRACLAIGIILLILFEVSVFI